ncbi:MAG: hypothetical protein U0P30_11750 [Vicinamibacterales bacterium]
MSAIDGTTAPWVSGLDPIRPAAIVAGADRIVVLGSVSDATQSSGVAAALDAVTGTQLWKTVVAPGRRARSAPGPGPACATAAR